MKIGIFRMGFSQLNVPFSENHEKYHPKFEVYKMVLIMILMTQKMKDYLNRR